MPSVTPEELRARVDSFIEQVYACFDRLQALWPETPVLLCSYPAPLGAHSTVERRAALILKPQPKLVFGGDPEAVYHAAHLHLQDDMLPTGPRASAELNALLEPLDLLAQQISGHIFVKHCLEIGQGFDEDVLWHRWPVESPRGELCVVFRKDYDESDQEDTWLPARLELQL